MACGIPVVGTSFALGGLRIVPNEHLLVADTPVDFAAAVLRLLSRRLSNEIARNARHLVEHSYSWESTVTDLERLYQEILTLRPL